MTDGLWKVCWFDNSNSANGHTSNITNAVLKITYLQKNLQSLIFACLVLF